MVRKQIFYHRKMVKPFDRVYLGNLFRLQVSLSFFTFSNTRLCLCVYFLWSMQSNQLVRMVELLLAQTTVDRYVFGANRKQSSGTHLPIIVKNASRFSTLQ